MRRVFVDCGSNTCRVLSERIERRLETEFYAFEPQPELRNCIDALRERFPETPIHFAGEAVWVVDGHCDLFLATQWGENHRGGSTLLRGHLANAAAVDYLHHELLVEFHSRMNASIGRERHDALCRSLAQRVKLTEWT